MPAPKESSRDGKSCDERIRRTWLIILAIVVGALSFWLPQPTQGGEPYRGTFLDPPPATPYSFLDYYSQFSRSCLPRPYGFAGLPVEGRVIGVVDGPLEAYAAEVSRLFPEGVPRSETAYVRDLMRARLARQVLDAEFTDNRSVAPPAPRPLPGIPVPNEARLQRLDVAASPIRSQGRAEFDALEVTLWGRSANQTAVPLHGTLRVTLWGLTQHEIVEFNSQVVARAGRLKHLADWTRTLTAARPLDPAGPLTHAHAVEAGTRLVLPLPRPLPEHDRTVFPWGALQIELLAPGEGSFNAFVDEVPLKQTGLVRDAVQLETGSRFLPHERTTDSRRKAGLSFERSSIRPESRILTVKP